MAAKRRFKLATLIGIAKAPKLLAEMEELIEARIEIGTGLQGDARGAKRQRQVSLKQGRMCFLLTERTTL